ncbi:MAG: malto-oligosyltrehalose synthase [Desulfuromonadales bacterium]
MHPELAATYRVQLRPDFGFEQTAEIVSYLADLGISHLYTSPCLQAAPGSPHGYDVVDPTRVNEELGGARAHGRLCETLQDAGLGQVVDVVPNHMAIIARQNPWWWDVLENGPSSRYAIYFDVDWEASEERWPNKVLLPVLGDHYGRILEDGEFRLSYSEGSFALHYYEHIFPIDPSSIADLLSRTASYCGSEITAFLAESHGRLPRPTVTARDAVERRHRQKAVLLTLLDRTCREEPDVAEALDAEIERLNRDPDALDALIDQQNYRLSFWRTASRDLGYRRFFDINDLAGLRVENLEVFHATHALPVSWVQKGWAQGLRIDHPDGLRDPSEYFRRLREACPSAWIVAEKILGLEEKLPSDWPIEGTTGYAFLNLAGGLIVDSEGEEALTKVYEEFTGEETDFDNVVRTSKRLVLSKLLESEINRLTSLFVDICERHRRYRDYTREELKETLLETAVCFPVYRSYIREPVSRLRPEDAHFVDEAIAGGMAERPDLDIELFSFLRRLLVREITGELEGELSLRFQQLTGSAMAKGVEDTTFYRYLRLVSLNEVGGDPSRFGVPVAQFHQVCEALQKEHPLAMLASTTHDTKRSEDVRARLALLSEIPERWGEAVQRWAAHNQRHRRGDWPDRNTEYLFYQTMVGAWPIEVERMTAYLEKAIREAKMHTSWTRQNADYEEQVRHFVTEAMNDEVFCADLESFVSELIGPGRINSLAQTLVKLTSPGVPDIYQGTELWDLSLVDPDNRRPVDFALRRDLLAELDPLSPEEILERMDEGLPKLWLVRQTLHLRRQRPELFGPEGSFRPLLASGEKADNITAFLRGDEVASVTPRLVMQSREGWGDTVIELPEGRWDNILTGEQWSEGEVRLDAVLARFPVGLLVRKE